MIKAEIVRCQLEQSACKGLCVQLCDVIEQLTHLLDRSLACAQHNRKHHQTNNSLGHCAGLRLQARGDLQGGSFGREGRMWS
jgi:hypothetical protein